MTDHVNGGRLDDALNQLFDRLESNVVAPRLTYLSIRDRMGEQERPSVRAQFVELLGSVFGKWRFPVTKSQIGTITAVVSIAVVVAVYVMVSGSDSDDGGVAPAVDPTTTPVPTTVPDPTATTIVKSTAIPIDPEIAAIVGEAKLKTFPAALKEGAPELSEEEVIDLWTGFIADTYWVESTDYVLSFCGASYGSTPIATFKAELEHFGWNWEVIGPTKFPARPWNSARVILDGIEAPGVGELAPPSEDGRLSTESLPDQPSRGPNNPLVFENSDCVPETNASAEPTPLPALPESSGQNVREIPEDLTNGAASTDAWRAYLSDGHMIAVDFADGELKEIDPSLTRYLSQIHKLTGTVDLLLCGDGRFHWMGTVPVVIADYSTRGWTGGQDGGWEISQTGENSFNLQLIPDDSRVILESVKFPVEIENGRFLSTLINTGGGTDLIFEVREASGCP